jgi:GTPase SAR1 family protein
MDEILAQGGLLHTTLTSTYDTALASGGGEPLNRSKLCLVGEGRVGKTCVLRAMLNKVFEETASTVGAQTSMLETYLAKQMPPDAAIDTCELERLNVTDWKVYTALGLEFDSAMAHHLAVLMRQMTNFAQERSKMPNDLTEEEAVELQQLVEGKGGGGASAGKEIRVLLATLRGKEQAEEVADTGVMEVVNVKEDSEEVPAEQEEEQQQEQKSEEEEEGSEEVKENEREAALQKEQNTEEVEDAGENEYDYEDDFEEDENDNEDDKQNITKIEVGKQQEEDVEEEPAVSRIPVDMVISLMEQGVNKRKIVFSTWDYGGQHIFRIVHHLFLTRFAIYLAVFNMADLVGDTATEETQETCLAELHSWLNDLWMHASQAPVLPVGTHKDVAGEPEQLQQVDALLRERFEGTKVPIIYAPDVPVQP